VVEEGALKIATLMHRAIGSVDHPRVDGVSARISGAFKTFIEDPYACCCDEPPNAEKPLAQRVEEGPAKAGGEGGGDTAIPLVRHCTKTWGAKTPSPKHASSPLPAGALVSMAAEDTLMTSVPPLRPTCR